jgi:uncharacterized protein YfkK (UPF0435 family)
MKLHEAASALMKYSYRIKELSLAKDKIFCTVLKYCNYQQKTTTEKDTEDIYYMVTQTELLSACEMQ